MRSSVLSWKSLLGKLGLKITERPQRESRSRHQQRQLTVESLESRDLMATLFWDTNGSTPGLGGVGTWNTSAANWTTDPTGSSATQAWNNAAGDIAVFKGTGAGVTIGSGIQASSLSIESNGYTLGSGSLSVNGTGEIQVATGISATISSQLTGSTNLSKTGTGTLTLSGSNTLSGNLTVSAGTLNAATGSNSTNPTQGSLGNGQATRDITVESGATLKFSGSDMFGNGSSSPVARLVVNGGTVTNNGGQFTTLGDVVLNGGSLTGTGGASTNYNLYRLNGSVTVTANSTISGSGTNAGIHLSSSSTTFNVSSGVTLDISAKLLNQAPLSTVVATSLAKSGSGTLILSSDNTYTGGTTISGGTLQVGNGGTTGSFGSGNVTNNASLIFNRSNSLSVSSILSGSGSVTQAGSGTTTLNGSNTFTGNVTVAAGSLNAPTGNNSVNPTQGSLGNAQSTRDITVESGATLRFTGNDMFGNGGSTPVTRLVINGGTVTNNSAQITTLGPVVLNGGTLTSTGGFSTNYASYSLTGSITVAANSTISGTGTNAGIHLSSSTTTIDVASGVTLNVSAKLVNKGPLSTPTAASFRKTGSGTLVLSADNAYTGVTTIDAGTLQVGDGGTAGSVGTGSVSNAASLIFNRSNSLTVSGVLSGSGSVTQAGTGTTTLSGNNTFTGNLTVAAGTLSAATGNNAVNPTSGSLGNGQATRDITVESGATLKFTGSDMFGNGGSTPIARLVINGGTVTNNGGQFTTLGDVVLNGGTLTGTGGASSNYNLYRLNGSVSVTANSTLSGAGTNAGVHLSSSSTTFEVASGVTLNVSAKLLNQAPLSTMTRTSLRKTGSGTIILTADNTYSGGTTIVSGTLQVGDGGTTGSLGSGLISIQSSIIFNRSDIVTVANEISGVGTLAQNGSGNLILSGVPKEFQGTSDVNSGALQVDTNMSSSPFTVQPGALLTGSGSTGEVTNNGGTVDNELYLVDILDKDLYQGSAGYTASGKLHYLGGGTEPLLITGISKEDAVFKAVNSKTHVDNTNTDYLVPGPAFRWQEDFVSSKYTGPAIVMEDRYGRSDNDKDYNDQYFKVSAELVSIDLDIDSNNDGEIDLDNSPAGKDDPIEATKAANKPGKVIAVNNDDSDNDGLLDFADFNGITGENSFAPIKLTVPNSVDLSKAMVMFVYDGSYPDPESLVSGDGTESSPYSYSLPPGKIRIWKKSGDLARDVTEDYINPDLGILASELFGTSRSIDLWVEAVGSSAAISDISIEVKLSPEGDSNYLRNDKILLTAVDGVNSTGDDQDKPASDNVAWTGKFNSKGLPEVTLRSAIEQSNNSAGKQWISFNIPTSDKNYSSPAFTINPSTDLPDITDKIFIDGSTQSDQYVANGNHPVIVIDGSGLQLKADNSTIKALSIINSAKAGITLDGSLLSTIEGNYLGLKADGITVAANDYGLTLKGGSIGNAIVKNVISGNYHAGLRITGSGTTLNYAHGNIIGADFTGMIAKPNEEDGVLIDDEATENRIGTKGDVDDYTQANTIAGNKHNGIRISGANTEYNLVTGNFIGVGRDFKSALPNSYSGVLIEKGASKNHIGRKSNKDGVIFELNIISGNTKNGIQISGKETSENTIAGNFIGLGNDLKTSIPNSEDGIRIDSNASNNLIGTDGNNDHDLDEYNIITGNTRNGIRISGSGTNNNRVAGNHIGASATLTAIGNSDNGILIEDQAKNNVVGVNGDKGSLKQSNYISGNTLNGIKITNKATENIIAGNYIGLNATANSAIANGKNGILIDDNSTNNLIGTDGNGNNDEFEKNIISGNKLNGISISGAGTNENSVAGNYIGANTEATAAIPNEENGILIDKGASKNRIGLRLNVASEKNIISGNKHNGVFIQGAGTNENKVSGNYIGTAADRTSDLHNNKNGVRIEDGEDNQIGSDGKATTPATEKLGNVIAWNGTDLNLKGHGVVVKSGNGNSIRRNSMFNNQGRGIDLGDDSFSINEVGDSGMGANTGLDNPVLYRIETGTTTTYTWMIDTNPGKYFIDYYSDTTLNKSGFGEGKEYLGSKTLTDSSQVWTFTTNKPNISATVTDELGNTSEFSMVDSDADAIADTWELNGIDVDEDGTIDLDLKSRGANPFHKDIFVEIDVMKDTKTGVDFSPLPGVLADVTSAFTLAPNSSVHNPDGANGITLHLDLDTSESIPVRLYPGRFVEFDEDKKLHFGTDADKTGANAKNVLLAKSLVYRYSIFGEGHSNDGSSGSAETDSGPTNDFMVTLGEWAVQGRRTITRDVQAGTFMHELGHTLGLLHGGFDGTEERFNYHSVMSYRWQYPDITGKNTGWELKYSDDSAWATLDERALDESIGLGGPAGHASHTVWIPGLGKSVPESGYIDWNKNGKMDAGPVAFDVNGNGIEDFAIVGGFDDWNNVRFYFWETANDGYLYDALGAGASNLVTASESLAASNSLATDTHVPMISPLYFALTYEVSALNAAHPITRPNIATHSMRIDSRIQGVDSTTANSVTFNNMLITGNSSSFELLASSTLEDESEPSNALRRNEKELFNFNDLLNFDPLEQDSETGSSKKGRISKRAFHSDFEEVLDLMTSGIKQKPLHFVDDEVPDDTIKYEDPLTKLSDL